MKWYMHTIKDYQIMPWGMPRWMVTYAAGRGRPHPLPVGERCGAQVPDDAPDLVHPPHHHVVAQVAVESKV